MSSNLRVGGYQFAFEYRHPLLRKLNGFLHCLTEMPEHVLGRRVHWTPRVASLAAVLMAFDPHCDLGTRCGDALACLAGDRAGLGRTYNGLLKALERQKESVLPHLKRDLRSRVQSAFDDIPRIAGWTLLAVDGSKEVLPRTIDQEKNFGIADNGSGPQAFLTTVVEVQTGMLWDWRIGQARSNERAHMREMVSDLPEQSLLLADSGFCGCPLWSMLVEGNKSFLIRVRGNVSLLEKLFPQARIERSKDIVYAWPKHHQRTQKPIRLRLIRVGSRRNSVYLLTNVLSPVQLSRRNASIIYRLRWGIESFYRTLKRTLGYAKLRSRCARRAWLELAWGLIAATIASLMGTGVLKSRRIDPRRQSPAAVVRVLRAALLHGCQTRAEEGLKLLNQALSQALKDTYARVRSKRSRINPITSATPSPILNNPPNLHKASRLERYLALTLYPAFAL